MVEKSELYFWSALLFALVSFSTIFSAIAFSRSIGVDHKNFLISVLLVAQTCTVFGVIKSRGDFDSVLIWSKINDLISFTVVGFVIGQLVRNSSH